MNTMFVNSTIDKPKVESIINAVATILHSQMLEVSSQVTIDIYCIIRISVRIDKFRKIANYFSFLKKNIFSKSQKLSISKELLY